MRRWGTIILLMMATVAPAVAGAQAAVKTADYAFDYSYPAAATRFPALRQWLDADHAALRASTARDAAANRREAMTGGFPFRPYETQRNWKVVTQTPRFLSLSGETYSYTGGAHGMTVSRALLWDRTARRRMVPRDLFVSDAAIQRAVGDAYCRALDRERARKRGAAVRRGKWPNQCVPTRDTTLLLGSTRGRAFDRIGLIADAYVAGSYAEGPYEVTLPVTPALLAAVKPAYRAAFVAR